MLISQMSATLLQFQQRRGRTSHLLRCVHRLLDADPDNRRSILLKSNLVENITKHKMRELVACLNKKDGSIKLALAIRDDIKSLVSKKSISYESVLMLDETLSGWLSNVFCFDLLELGLVRYETSSGSLLEKVARGEAVHKVRSLSELKSRLSNGKRCFALFHPKLESEPLVFVHTALTSEIATSLSTINAIREDALSPECAIFYSITLHLQALSGLDLATRLLHCTAQRIIKEFPTVRCLSTLSPVPGFVGWAAEDLVNVNGARFIALGMPEACRVSLCLAVAKLRLALSSGQASSTFAAASDRSTNNNDNSDASVVEQGGEASVLSAFKFLARAFAGDFPGWLQLPDAESLRPAMLWLGCYYIACAKNRKAPSQPRDYVAKFHLRNGACFYRLNWSPHRADSGDSVNSGGGGAGFLANYVYAKEAHSSSQSESPISASGGFGDDEDLLRFHVDVSGVIVDIIGGETLAKIPVIADAKYTSESADTSAPPVANASTKDSEGTMNDGDANAMRAHTVLRGARKRADRFMASGGYIPVGPAVVNILSS